MDIYRFYIQVLKNYNDLVMINCLLYNYLLKVKMKKTWQKLKKFIGMYKRIKKVFGFKKDSMIKEKLIYRI